MHRILSPRFPPIDTAQSEAMARHQYRLGSAGRRGNQNANALAGWGWGWRRRRRPRLSPKSKAGRKRACSSDICDNCPLTLRSKRRRSVTNASRGHQARNSLLGSVYFLGLGPRPIVVAIKPNLFRAEPTLSSESNSQPGRAFSFLSLPRLGF